MARRVVPTGRLMNGSQKFTAGSGGPTIHRPKAVLRKIGVLACQGRRASGLSRQPGRLFAMTAGTAVFRTARDYLDALFGFENE